MASYGIIVIGFKNVNGIRRLLDSLSRVDFCGDKEIKLIISIDFSGDDSVEKLARSFEWKNGEKIILAYDKNLGLKKHILLCGGYMNTYNLSAVAVLEDDIYVSPEMYKYMRASVEYYSSNPKIAGISLYKHEYNINAKHPFSDYSDYGDTFFMQYAMSWGQIWIKDKWNQFIKWYDDECWKKINPKKIPNNLKKWKNSWLKYHIMYCIDQDLYFVYPRISLTTNFSDVGAHNKSYSTAMQVKMCMKKENDWQFTSFEDTMAIYDAFFENVKLVDFFKLDNLEIDLYGIKDYCDDTKYVLTTKKLPYKVIKSWGLQLRPFEANIILDIPGEVFFLYDKSINEKKRRKGNNKDMLFEYDLKGVNIVCFSNIKYCIKFVFKYLKIKLKRFKKRK